jgi:hypothetical protein
LAGKNELGTAMDEIPRFGRTASALIEAALAQKIIAKPMIVATIAKPVLLRM